MDVNAEALRGYMEYLRDLGIYDVYRTGEPSEDPALTAWWKTVAGSSAAAVASALPTRQALAPPARQASAPLTRPPSTPVARPAASISQRAVPSQAPAGARVPARGAVPEIVLAPPVGSASSAATTAGAAPPTYDFDDSPQQTGSFAPPAMPLISFNQLAPLPSARVTAADKASALQQVRDTIGDCTRCPLAYAGRHTIVFADGDPNAQLMFVGEGPGADEDESGVPFVGKAGQLLNNMITAMGLKREQVYIANIVKCRPPKNRVPEPVEANTCSQFLLQQIDIVQPKIIVALGSTAATYLLGVRSSLAGLRGQWHEVRGAKCAVTFHPAFLLRDPRQKGEAWKDLQRVMVELGLKPPAKA